MSSVFPSLVLMAVASCLFCWVLNLNMQTVTQSGSLWKEWLSDIVIYCPSFEQQNIPQLEEVNFQAAQDSAAATFVLCIKWISPNHWLTDSWTDSCLLPLSLLPSARGHYQNETTNWIKSIIWWKLVKPSWLSHESLLKRWNWFSSRLTRLHEM